jgi:hypothetical protein
MNRPQSLAYALGATLLPLILTARQVRLHVSRRAERGRFLAALPAVAVLTAAWAAGEAAGYLTLEA